MPRGVDAKLRSLTGPAEERASPPVAWRHRWRTRLLGAFLLVALAVAMVEVFGVARAFSRAREAAITRQAETAASLALATELFVARYVALAETTARALGDPRLGPEARPTMLESLLAANPEVGVVFLSAPTGLVAAAAHEPPPELDVADRDYFRAVATGATSAVSNVLLSKRTGRPGVAIAARLRGRDGAFGGAVVVGLPTDRLGDALAIRLSEGAVAVIVDRAGRVVVHGGAPDLPWEARDYSRLPLVADALRGRRSQATGFADPAGGDRLLMGAMAPAQRLGWAVGVLQTLDTALAGARRERSLALGAGSAVAALGMALALVLSRWLGAPVAALSAGVTALARGDRDHLVAVRGRHELARLASEFNAMSREVLRAREAARSLNEELLAANEELQANAAQLEENLGELEAANQSLDEAVGQAEAERQRLATTLDSLPDGVLVADADGTLLVANGAARRLLGPQYRPGLALLAPATPPPAPHRRGERRLSVEELPLWRALSRGEATLDLELSVEAPGGETRHLVATAVPLSARAGARIGAVAVLRDVTAERTVQALKDQFIARASHELRTPLTAIRGTLRFLRRALDGKSQESPAELLEMAERNVDQMVRLIDDLLDVSRLQTGRLTLAPEPMEVEDALERVITAVGPAAREKGVALELDVEGGLRLVADPLKLDQVLTNLLGNAVKFTPAGGSVRLVACRRGQEIELAVRDTGPGLAQEHLARVFEPFFQAVGSGRPERMRGAGLGLTIAKGIVDLHGGRIWAESEGPGTGCTFVVRLPDRETEGRAA